MDEKTKQAVSENIITLARHRETSVRIINKMVNSYLNDENSDYSNIEYLTDKIQKSLDAIKIMSVQIDILKTLF